MTAFSDFVVRRLLAYSVEKLAVRPVRPDGAGKDFRTDFVRRIGCDGRATIGNKLVSPSASMRARAIQPQI
jgi:hypothetical protein